MNTDAYARGAHVATIIAALVTAVALGISAWQFNQTQAAQSQVKAIELLVEYNKFMRERVEQKADEEEEARFWKGNLALSIAESIWILTQGDPGWEATVKWMLVREAEFITKSKLDCSTYNSGFIKFAARVLNQQICAT